MKTQATPAQEPLIFGHTWEEIQAMQQGQNAKRAVAPAAKFTVGQRLEWKCPSMWHWLNSMVVTKAHPLTVKFQGTGAVGEVCDYQVQPYNDR